RSFNFELQAAATENAIILSLGTSQSFELASVARFLKSATVREILIQAMLDSPMFTVRWRWNATCALAIKRFQGGRKAPPYLLRMQAEDLVSSIFPDQLACIENIQGEREIPDHPLVEQTIHDCLTEAMNLERLIELLTSLEDGSIAVIARDLIEPSPLAAEILTAANYAFLDDAPAEERRTRAVNTKPWLDPAQATDLAHVNPDSIKHAVQQRKPPIRTADECCDLLDQLGFLSIPAELDGDFTIMFDILLGQGRATRLIQSDQAQMFWVSAQRLHEMRTIHPDYQCSPELILPKELIDETPSRETAIVNVLRSRLTHSIPMSTEELAQLLDISVSDVEVALLHLENEGTVLRGKWLPKSRDEQPQHTDQNQSDHHIQWCERTLLANSHHQSIRQQRQSVEPVSSQEYYRFLFDWQHLTRSKQLQGAEAIGAVLDQLQGYPAPICVWQKHLIHNRIKDLSDLQFWLDALVSSGQYLWLRLDNPNGSQTLTQTTPITFIPRHALSHWQSCTKTQELPQTSASAQRLADILKDSGALFYDELQSRSGYLKSQFDDSIRELVTLGLVSCDLYSGLTHLFNKPASRRKRLKNSFTGGGRWSLIHTLEHESIQTSNSDHDTAMRYLALCLLKRYGIIFKNILTREHCSGLWQSMLPVLKRMEWSGEIRSGRFINGQFGQQFALPEAVQQLNKMRQSKPCDEAIIINATDPLNLVGIITPGEKISAHAGNRILFQNGQAIAYLASESVVFLTNVEKDKHWTIKKQLIQQYGLMNTQHQPLI
ncbi:MAG: ATP-dependent DNA helicase, partial [Gammaproteobacteria bacterium]|nr:ATP-dependent DNA helicase [Gammaproteobacteria bacterium]